LEPLVTTRSTPVESGLPRRARILIVSSVTLITLLAWLYLVYLHRQMSADMQESSMMAAMGMPESAPWRPGDVLFTLGMWAVMMVGMMAPSATPMVLLFAAARARRGDSALSAASALFGLGYLAVWTGFSAVAALAQWALHDAALLSSAMKASSPRVAGAVLLVAGIYQITPWKNACLSHCRSPLDFLISHWHDGKYGALQMGARHGAYCLGCCWAIMALLFVVGVMNLVWVAALAALVLLEKLAPQGVWLARISGAIMIVLGFIALV
jgi:predicted metal-binding membrane protein